VGCYIWYSEEGTGWGCSLPILAVPNVTAHPSTASVPVTVLLHNDPWLCSFDSSSSIGLFLTRRDMFPPDHAHKGLKRKIIRTAQWCVDLNTHVSSCFGDLVTVSLHLSFLCLFFCIFFRNYG